MATGSYLSVITLNVNGLNAPTKRQRLAEWIQKLKVPFRGLLTLMVIFHALKDKRRVLVLRKGYNI